MTQTSLPYLLRGDEYSVDLPHPRHRSPETEARILAVADARGDAVSSWPEEPGWYDVLCRYEFELLGECPDALDWLERDSAGVPWWDAPDAERARRIKEEAVDAWVSEHGSELLRRSFERGYRSERGYLDERAAHEWPGAIRDRDDAVLKRIAPSASPSAAALSTEETYGGALNLRIGWISGSLAERLDRHDLPEGEYLVVTGWLGRHTLLAPVSVRARHDDVAELPYRPVLTGVVTAVCGTAGGVGVTTAAASLAASLARDGYRTLLVGAAHPLSFPLVTMPSGALDAEGLSPDAILTETAFARYLGRLAGEPGVAVLPSPPTGILREVVGHALGHYEHVVVDAGVHVAVDGAHHLVAISRADRRAVEHLGTVDRAGATVHRLSLGGSTTTLGGVLVESLPASHTKAIGAADSGTPLIDVAPDYASRIRSLAGAIAAAAPREEEASPARVITVASPKGGVGKSTMATNLAYGIAARNSNLRVLLVDGDIANGNLALRIAGRLEPNLLDLINHMDEQMRERIDPLMGPYDRDISPYVLASPSVENVDVLAAPDNPDVLQEIEQTDLERLLRAWRHHYDVVIIDAGTQLSEHTNQAWLQYADQVYLMVEPEISCLHATKEYASRAHRLQLITPQVCRLVMIRSDSPPHSLDPSSPHHGLDPRELAETVFDFIPPAQRFFFKDRSWPLLDSHNAGEPLILVDRAYAKEMRPVIDEVMRASR